MTYDWKNVETGEIVETENSSIPPGLPGTWKRVFSFGIGSVQGGGGSPPRRVSQGG